MCVRVRVCVCVCVCVCVHVWVCVSVHGHILITFGQLEIAHKEMIFNKQVWCLYMEREDLVHNWQFNY